MKIMLFALSLLISTSTYAASPWHALGQKLIQRENFMEGAGIYALTHIQPIPDGRQADYLTTDFLVGNEDGTYEPGYVRAISESWIRNKDGNWEIDQWIHTASQFGELRDISHHWILETDQGTILDYKYLRTGPASDPTEISRWNAVKSRWYATLD